MSLSSRLLSLPAVLACSLVVVACSGSDAPGGEASVDAATLNGVSVDELVKKEELEELLPEASDDIPITSDRLPDGVVTTPKIADQAVTAAKLKPGAVGVNHLSAGARETLPGRRCFKVVNDPANGDPETLAFNLPFDCAVGAEGDGCTGSLWYLRPAYPATSYPVPFDLAILSDGNGFTFSSRSDGYDGSVYRSGELDLADGWIASASSCRMKTTSAATALAEGYSDLVLQRTSDDVACVLRVCESTVENLTP